MPNVVTYTALIDAYARVGNARRSEEILRLMTSTLVPEGDRVWVRPVKLGLEQKERSFQNVQITHFSMAIPTSFGDDLAFLRRLDFDGSLT